MRKSCLEDLAFFGGAPAFEHNLHVGRPNMPSRQHLLKRINDVLDSRWLTNRGPQVQEFERRVAELVGVRHCIAICNATSALEIAVRASRLTGEVIIPSFTFVATAHALQWQHISPVFCDVDSLTHNIDPCKVEQMISPRTTGIIGVHLWGRACDVDALTEIAQRRHLKLLFDAAQAFGCSYKRRMIGNFGNAEVFSFHGTKVLNTFEGGAVVTNDDELAANIRLMKNFGFADYDNVVSVGTNGKMSEVAAAMGLTSLDSVEEFIAANHRNYIEYQRQLIDLFGVRLSSYDEDERCNYQYVVLEIDETIMGVGRDLLQDILWAENILARRYFYPGCHRMEPYRSGSPNAGLLLPNTERVAARVLCLPTGTAVGSNEIGRICQVIQLVCEHGHEIGERVAASGN